MSLFEIRLYRVASGGSLEDLKMEFSSDELGNTVPAVGDLIVDPGVLSGMDRRDPGNRYIYEVAGRYFLPGAHKEVTYVALVVNVRNAHEGERDVACIS